MTPITRNIAIICTLAFVIVGVFLLIKNKTKKPEKNKAKKIYLLGGLDYRSGDKKIDEQVDLVKKGSNLEVEGFRYNDSKGIISAINQSNNPMYVILFSKGGEYSKQIANTMKSKNYDLSNLFIVEPYAKSSNTSNSVKSAVLLGVPSKNVIVGNSIVVGKGVVENATNTPSCSPYHWCSLEMVGEIISKI